MPDAAPRRGQRARVLATAALSLTLMLATSFGCSQKTADFEDVKPADELYAEGLEKLEGRKILGLFTLINYDSAIESFQAIIDNYPYSEFEQKAQLKIADAYFDDSRYEEALAYYQDFADLHPQHPRVALRAAARGTMPLQPDRIDRTRPERHSRRQRPPSRS